MIFKSDQLVERLENKAQSTDPFVIVPQPQLDDLRRTGAASVDLRLGSWFVAPRLSRLSHLDVSAPTGGEDLPEATRSIYVPLGDKYILHPRNFVLGATLEWLRLPRDMAGYVTAKSSWGRRGLVIATAIGVHPGFTGCLTLELTNLGEVPIAIQPGMQICQVFLHTVHSSSEDVDRSPFLGYRRPTLGVVKLDDVAIKLGQSPTN
jgi:dCTP deaminase